MAVANEHRATTPAVFSCCRNDLFAAGELSVTRPLLTQMQGWAPDGLGRSSGKDELDLGQRTREVSRGVGPPASSITWWIQLTAVGHCCSIVTQTMKHEHSGGVAGSGDEREGSTRLVHFQPVSAVDHGCHSPTHLASRAQFQSILCFKPLSGS